MMKGSLRQILGEPGSSRILVLGDLILDRYLFGRTDRVSPEAPVLVLDTDDEESRPGGAAAVAFLASGLGAQVTVAGVVGSDSEGRLLRQLLDERNIDHEPVICDPDRPTTRKQRLLGRVSGRQLHQILRVDRELRQPLSGDLQRQLVEVVIRRLDDHHVLLVSDYAKGVCTAPVLKAVFTAAARRIVPVVVDPACVSDYACYRGATLLTPNRTEAAAATGLSIHTPTEAVVAAARLCRHSAAEAVLVTLDRQGVALAQADGSTQVFSTRPRNVVDVTGAGDMVLAVLGLGTAAETSIADSISIANLAAGLEVERLGVAAVTRDELQDVIDSHGCCAAGRCKCRQPVIKGVEQ